jgi:hypothetical protein
MSDTDDDMLQNEFKARVLLAIRDECQGFDLYHREDGSYCLSLSIYEDLAYREDFSKVILEEIQMNKGDDEAIRALSAFLRAQADEVDKAIGFRWASTKRSPASDTAASAQSPPTETVLRSR